VLSPGDETKKISLRNKKKFFSGGLEIAESFLRGMHREDDW